MTKKYNVFIQNTIGNIDLLEQYIMDKELLKLDTLKAQLIQSLEAITDGVKILSSKLKSSYKSIKENILQKIFNIKSFIEELSLIQVNYEFKLQDKD